MVFVQPLSFVTARETVLRTITAAATRPAVETVSLGECMGRVLAQDALADRPYPPLPRSMRDGFAVRTADLPGTVHVVGEVRAGETFGRALEKGEAVEIMTGAPVPDGADAVVMIEHSSVTEDRMTTTRAVRPGDHIVPAAAERAKGDIAVPSGTRIDFGHIAALATVGIARPAVYRRPEAAILATGDELISVDATPVAHQIRNSNSWTLAAQVVHAGATPRVLPVAADEYNTTRDLIEQGLGSNLLLLSGGVSAGKYDLVEKVLADLGAEFFFDRVLIQPGQPLVFGRVGSTFFFGLPGNPASTMVTFELFARAALDLMGGSRTPQLPFTHAILRAPFRHQPTLTRFLPACVTAGEVVPVAWQGSGDVFALARANAFLVARDDRETWNAGDSIEVLLR